MWFVRRLLLLLPGNRSRRERDLDEEIRTHVELAADEARSRGASPLQARRIARTELGNAMTIREDSRAVWGFAFIDRTRQDLQYALRTARRAPLFTIVAIGSLGGGLAAATLVFSLVHGLLLKPLPYPTPDRIVYAREIVPSVQQLYPSLPVNMQHFRFWREHARSFESLAAIGGGTATIVDAGDPERVGVADITAELFSIVGARPQLGRTFTAGEELRRERVVVISHGLWQRRFGGSATALGRTLPLDGLSHVIIGVLPADFWFPAGKDFGALTGLRDQTDVFRPLEAATAAPEGWSGDYDYIVLGRLAGGVTIDQARAELDSLQRRIDAEHRAAPGLRAQMHRLQNAVTQPIRSGLYLLFFSVLMLLVVVSVNLAALLLARSMSRAREFSIRTALGAGRTRLFQQVFAETVVLVVTAAVLAVTLARALLRLVVTSSLVDLPGNTPLQLDATVVAFGACLAVGCAFFIAWVPAMRVSGVSPQTLIKAGGTTLTDGIRTLQLRGWLVGAEVAVSIMLVFAAGLLVASLARILHVDRGFRADHALAVSLTIPESRYPTTEERNRFFEEVLEHTQALPGVTSAAFISGLPLTGESQVNAVRLEGSDQDAIDPTTRDRFLINVRFISPQYFSTMGVPLIDGRMLTSTDATRHVAVVSDRLARTIWGSQSPVGRRFSTGSRVGSVEIVGVVGDVPNASIEQGATPIAYVPFGLRGPLWGDIVIRTAVAERAIVADVRRAVQAVDPSVPLAQVRTVDELVSAALVRRRFQMLIATGFAAAALTITVLGIYGVVAYNAALRRKEIGIRVALGARPRNVVAAMMLGGLRPVAAGIVAGLAVSLAAAPLMRSLLFGVSAAEPAVIGGAIAMLAVAAVLATFLPARAAARLDPLRTLRSD